MSDEERILRLENAISTLAELPADQHRITEEQQRLLTDQQRLSADQQRRTARLEESFVTLVDLIRRHDERLDDSQDRMGELRAAQTESERKIATLADAQTHTEHRLDALIDIVRQQHKGQG